MINTRARRKGVGRAAAAVLAATTLVAGCSGGSSKSVSQSVFTVTPGECFDAPTKVQAELSSLKRVACDQAHTREAYAVVDYTPPVGAAADAYPGSDALSTFAKGACAQRYGPYVGVD